MLSLMTETMTGKSSRMRESTYYKKFWQTFTSCDQGALFFAYENDTPIAGAFVLKFGNKATYKDGGSVHRKTIYGSSHALQWHIIEWLSGQGVTTYDLCGTPPSNEIDNKNHPYYGIGLFKTSFNKAVTDFVGVYDIIVQPSRYVAWKRVGERIIQRYYATILHQYFY
jgi:lipid II:glycine glycyltransferase (peptidoglycan interpeptide bridge formation enzyme)